MKLTEYRRISFMPNPPRILANPEDIEKIPGHWVPTGEKSELEELREVLKSVEPLKSLLREAECGKCGNTGGILVEDDCGPWPTNKRYPCDFCTRRSQLLGEGNE